jgi:hypothetical protein
MFFSRFFGSFTTDLMNAQEPHALGIDEEEQEVPETTIVYEIY